jgi:hypothetical protein
MSAVDTNLNKQEDWINSKWRPAMGWMYLVVCTFDFIVAPILWSLLNTITHGSTVQWDPLTLRGAGLFHISMGAVLGLAAYGRTQEKLAGANNGGLNLPNVTSTPSGLSGGFTAPESAEFVAPALSSNVKKVIPTSPDPVL